MHTERHRSDTEGQKSSFPAETSIFFRELKPGEPRISGHVLGQVGEEDGQVEADGLGGVVVRLRELHVVDLTLVVRLLVAADEEVDLLQRVLLGLLQLVLEVLGEDGAVLVDVRLLEGCRVAQILQLEEHVAVFENHLDKDANYDFVGYQRVREGMIRLEEDNREARREWKK